MPNPASSRALLIRLLALTSGFPLMAAHADSVWDPIELPKSERVRWQPYQQLPRERLWNGSGCPSIRTPR